MTNTCKINGATKVVAVWGHPVSHSLSPAMHNAALRELGLNWVYVPFDVDPASIESAVAAVRTLGLEGVNVTVPLKQAVLAHLDEIDGSALAVGSVNTIHNINGRLRGASTDGPGFLRALEAAGQEISGRRAYLLGAGGSARAVAFALAAEGAEIQIANRSRERAAALVASINALHPRAAASVEWGGGVAPFDLLVNTTSLGMSPDHQSCPELPSNPFRDQPFVFDLIYAPAETRLLREARSAGCETVNGVGMLVYQGALSLSLWSGLPLEELPIALMTAAVKGGLQREN